MWFASRTHITYTPVYLSCDASQLGCRGSGAGCGQGSSLFAGQVADQCMTHTSCFPSSLSPVFPGFPTKNTSKNDCFILFYTVFQPSSPPPRARPRPQHRTSRGSSSTWPSAPRASPRRASERFGAELEGRHNEKDAKRLKESSSYIVHNYR